MSDNILDQILNKDPSELIPWEPCVLPSRGLYYDNSVPGGEVQVRAMGLQEEKILATERLAQSGQALDMIFKNCVKFPDEDFDPAELLAGDKAFLLFYLRGITHGENYEFAVPCSNADCGITTMHNYNLNHLGETIKWADESIGSEPFKVVLPYFSKVAGREFYVKIRFLRSSDTKSLRKERSAKQRIVSQARNKGAGKAVNIDNSLEDTYKRLIVEAMGETDRVKINNLVSRMHSLDTSTIRKFLSDHTPGIDTQIEIVCHECSNEMTIDLPITENFFRPAESAEAPA